MSPREAKSRSKRRVSVIEMSRGLFFGAGALILLLAMAGWRMANGSRTEVLFEPKARLPEAAPLCPWREPEADLKQFFPEATRYEVQTHILSGLRVELTERLGRAPTGDENALAVYHVSRDNTVLGTVLTRRVKGENGAIEIVLAADAGGHVTGLRLQRLREPEPVARLLQNREWLRSFEGKRADSSWQIGGDIPDVPPEARPCAEAIVGGARSLLVLLAAADQAPPPNPVAAHHH